MISVLILTLNEEQNLPGCLKSVAWCDDIHVYDSHSTDKTTEIAEAFGAKVTKRPFDNWADHQNWGLKNISFAHPWVFYIDADERMQSGLAENIRTAVSSGADHVAYMVRRRDYFFDRPLKYAQSCKFYIRLFRPEHVHYERLVHPVTNVAGSVGRVEGRLEHYPFSKGMAQWLKRHVGYSEFEARQILENRAKGEAFRLRSALFAPRAEERLHHRKELFHRLPLRPLIRFLYLYAWRLGILDGRAGLSYSALQAFYEFMVVLEERELSGRLKHPKKV
jgi:glycosyltransferase involved in cell wall biosynthesis